MINKKSVLIAVWAALLLIFLTACSKTYTVTFDTNGGMRTGGGELQQKVEEGGSAVPPIVEKTGYRFVSWNDVISPIYSDKTVSAIWEKVHTVTFDPAGGTVVSGESEQIVPDGGYAFAPIVEREGYIFDGWDRDFLEVKYTMTVTAKWLKLHTVTFDPNGGLAEGELVQIVKDGSAAEAPTVARSGYLFDGWDMDFSNVTQDMTVKALWSKAYIVTFDLDGGSLVSGYAAQSVRSGSSAIPPEVRRDGYVLDGWTGSYENVTEDVTVKAIWAKAYTVTFDLNGGTLTEGVLVQTVKEGEAAVAPACTRSGYEFMGWSVPFNDVRSDITVVAQWSTATYTSTEIYTLAAPATVELTVYNKSGVAESLGSGFFIDENGTIATNYHVIESAYRITATLSDGSVYEVTHVLGYDESRDLTVVKIEKSDTPFLKISGREIKTGETVYALGSSKGLTGTFSNGIVSSASRLVEGINCIQITAPISTGNSGGPLLNIYGEVIGVNSLTLTTGQNINFAVNIKELAAVDTSSPITIEQFYLKTAYYQMWIYDDNRPEVEPNNSMTSAQLITSNGQTINGWISSDSDIDYYRYRVTVGGRLTVLMATEMPSDIEKMYCVLLDDNGGILAIADVVQLTGGNVIQVLFFNVKSDAKNIYVCCFLKDDYGNMVTPNYDLFVYLKPN